MVEVLNVGSGSMECKCENCASTLRFKPSEVNTEKRNWDYLGDYDLVRVIRCPNCGETTKVK